MNCQHLLSMESVIIIYGKELLNHISVYNNDIELSPSSRCKFGKLEVIITVRTTLTIIQLSVKFTSNSIKLFLLDRENITNIQKYYINNNRCQLLLKFSKGTFRCLTPFYQYPSSLLNILLELPFFELQIAFFTKIILCFIFIRILHLKGKQITSIILALKFFIYIGFLLN